MQKRKPVAISDQSIKPLVSSIVGARAGNPTLHENVYSLESRVKQHLLTEATSNLITPMLQLGGEGKGPPKRVLLQDLCPKLWSWFDSNCSTYGFVPLHRKEHYMPTRGNGKRRDVKRPDIVPRPDHVAYRYRCCNNFNEKQKVLNTRSILQDSDEYFIELLTTWHKNRWFEVLGRGGRLDVLSPSESTHLKVPTNNAMEEDHSREIGDSTSVPQYWDIGYDDDVEEMPFEPTSVDEELKIYCALPNDKESIVNDMFFNSSNDEDVGELQSFYPEVQKQRLERQRKLSKHHYFKRKRGAMAGFTSYLVSLKPKYKKHSVNITTKYSEDMNTSRVYPELDDRDYTSRHSPANVTVPLDLHPTMFIGYEIGDSTPYYHNRLHLNGILGTSEKRFNTPLYEAREGIWANRHRLARQRGIQSLSSYLSTLKSNGVSTRWKLKNVPSIVKLLSFIDSLSKGVHKSKAVEKVSEGIFSKVIDKHGNHLDYATPYSDGHLLFQAVRYRASQDEVVKAAVSTIATNAIRRVQRKRIPSSLEVDNLDLFKKRSNSFTKQIYIEPIDDGSQKDNVIMTLDKESNLSANQAIVQEVMKDPDLFNQVMDRVKKSTCPACGKV